MKILYVYNSLALWGGVERILVDKMNYLADVYGYEVYMLTYNQGSHVVPFEMSSKVHYEDLHVNTHHQYHYRGPRRYLERYRRNRLLCQRLSEQLHAIDPDIIVTSTAGELRLLLRLKGRAKLLIESHSDFAHVVEADVMNWRRRAEQRQRYRLLRQVDMLVALTEADAERWRALTPCVKVVPNIVHLNTSGQYSSLAGKHVIFVGRFARQKAVPDLLEAWQIVNRRHPDWTLDLYGEGEHKDELTAVVQQLDANVSVHEPTADILEKYRESSLFVLTSLYEPFGLVIPEAMSCGLPVVSFEGDGPNSIITDGKDGYIVRDRNIQAFADSVCRLIEDETLRKRMGQAAIQTAQRYSAACIMPQWKELFESLAEKREYGKLVR